MQTDSFKSAVRAVIASTPIGSLLASRNAVVLERIARGGGATKWYYCSSRSSLEVVQIRFSPGSVVSFYFDERIRTEAYSPSVKTAVEAVIRQSGEAVFGTLSEDGILINADIISGANELDEFLLVIKPGVRVFYGAFPARDNDGVRAVTLIVPDADATVRLHPH